MKIKKFAFGLGTSGQYPFCVRIVPIGCGYGAQDVNGVYACTNDDKEALVEFYDCRYMHTPFGQFVSRYFLSTMLEAETFSGLALDGGIADWTISRDAMVEVIAWLKEANKCTTQPTNISC